MNKVQKLLSIGDDVFSAMGGEEDESPLNERHWLRH